MNKPKYALLDDDMKWRLVKLIEANEFTSGPELRPAGENGEVILNWTLIFYQGPLHIAKKVFSEISGFIGDIREARKQIIIERYRAMGVDI